MDRRLQVIFPLCPPLLPCPGTATLIFPVFMLAPAPQKDFPPLRSCSLVPSSCSKYGNRGGRDALSTRTANREIQQPSTDINRGCNVSWGGGLGAEGSPIGKGELVKTFLRPKGADCLIHSLDAMLTSDPKKVEKFLFKLYVHRNCIGKNTVRKRPLCHTPGVFYLPAMPKAG